MISVKKEEFFSVARRRNAPYLLYTPYLVSTPASGDLLETLKIT